MKSAAENRPSDEKKNISKRLKMIPSSSYEQSGLVAVVTEKTIH